MSISKLLKILIPVVLVISIIAGSVFNYFSKLTHYTTDYDNGNSAGNLYNGGYFCEKDGVIYFANTQDDNALYSMERTGLNLKKLTNDKVQYINADGNYVYYTRTKKESGDNFNFFAIAEYALCRIDTSGKNTKVLDKEPSLYARQMGDYIYYIHYDKEEASTLYKVKIDGTDKEQITKEPIIAVCGVGPNLYYAGVSDHALHVLNVETGAVRTVIEDGVYNPIIDGDYAYYMDVKRDYHIVKTNMLDGTTTEITSDRADCFNMVGSYIYYQKNSSTDPALKRITISGEDEEVILSGNFCNINVTSTNVYFTMFEDQSTFFYTPSVGAVNVSTFYPEVIED